MALSVFPDLLTYGFFAPLILRVAVGCFFLITGYRMLGASRRVAMQSALESRLGTLSPILVWGVTLSYLIVGALLLVGYVTQVAALLGLVIALKSLWICRTHPSLAGQSRFFYILLAAIMLSLLLTGAGARAFDLPL